jgi:hypothetical protein
VVGSAGIISGRLTTIITQKDRSCTFYFVYVGRPFASSLAMMKCSGAYKLLQAKQLSIVSKDNGLTVGQGLESDILSRKGFYLLINFC